MLRYCKGEVEQWQWRGEDDEDEVKFFILDNQNFAVTSKKNIISFQSKTQTKRSCIKMVRKN